MRSVKAIFIKQAKDMFKNPMVLVMFIIFPVVALIMTELVAKSNDDIPNNMFVTMMAAIFAGMGLVTSASGVIAEDIERKSLRFLIIAGVKPHQYLIGTGGFFVLAGTVTSIAFAFIGDFSGTETVKFLSVMITGAATSVILGMTIGMFSKNQQAATSLGMPVAVIVGFTPMVAAFNETVEKFASILYTQQINVIVNDFSVGVIKPILVIILNISVLTILFVSAYKLKGLKG
jgi:ABC-2 type transport system permease protein